MDGAAARERRISPTWSVTATVFAKRQPLEGGIPGTRSVSFELGTERETNAWGESGVEAFMPPYHQEVHLWGNTFVFDFDWYNAPWSRGLAPTGAMARGGTWTVTFETKDRGLLTDGYKVLIEAQDYNGNLNAVEKEGTLEKNFVQKAEDLVLDFVNSIVRGFLTWLVETVGPVFGLLLGFLRGMGQNFLDMIFGLAEVMASLPQMFGIVHEMEAVFSNPGTFVEMSLAKAGLPYMKMRKRRGRSWRP